MVTGIRRVAVACTIGLAATLAACGGGGGDGEASDDAGFRFSGDLRVQTVESGDGRTYDYEHRGDRVTVSAPEGSDAVEVGDDPGAGVGGIREAFWIGGQPRRSDQEVCASLAAAPDGGAPGRGEASRSELVAPGVALRIRPAPRPGRVGRVIVVRPDGGNGAPGMFTVNMIEVRDVDGVATMELDRAESMDFGDVVGGALGNPETGAVTTTTEPSSWNVCARAIGTEVSAMVWTDDEPRPGWSDTERVRTAEVPRAWVGRGYAGAYVEDLSPGHDAVFEDLEVVAPY